MPFLEPVARSWPMSESRRPEPAEIRPRHTDAEGRPLIPVDPIELRHVISVWLKTMPPRLWRPYLAMLDIDPKRRLEEDRVDPREVVAAYIAECFGRARWVASYPEPPAPASPPPWRDA